MAVDTQALRNAGMSDADIAALASFDPSKLNLGAIDILGRNAPATTNPFQTFTAPLSNKGNPTSKLAGNQFAVYENQPIRLVDHRTNQVVFEGTGYDAARKASELGQNLTDTLGRKANYSIQTADPSGAYSTVAYEKRNKSTLGKIGSVAGTALPIAVGFIPGVGQLATGLQLAIGAGAGAVGAGLRGQDILKGGLMGGLSAAGGKIVGDALKGAGMGLSANAARSIGTGLGTTAGGLATGQSLKNSLIGGVTSGGLSYLGGEAFGKRGGTTTSGGGDTGSYGGGGGGDLGDIVVTAGIPRFTGTLFPTSFADKAQLNSNETNPYQTGDFAVPTPAAANSGLTQDSITVTARPTPTTGTSTFAVGAPKVNTDFSVPDEIIVEAQKAADTTTAPLAVGGPDIPVDTKFPDEIEVTAKKVKEPTTGSSVLTVPGLTPLPKDIVDAAEKATDAKDKDGFGVKEALALLGLLGSIGGGGGGTGTGTGTGKLQPTFSAKLPTPGEGGSLKVGGLKGPTLGAAGTYSARPVTDWYRYGMGPAMDIPAGTDLSGATSPYAGYGPGTLGQETFKSVSGVPEQPTGMSHGGPMGYARGSSRESFAVNGPGTGRSDDIPAVLSDGEYVIDAETVALLGDGSSKAGAKRLDELRVNLRKHKGRNLAKGKFSVNAKRPEKYLSGGRA
jgi:hypothetical protein